MKRAVLILLILSLCLSLCACGASAPEPTPEPTPEATPEPTPEPPKAFSADPEAITSASESVVMISVYDSKNELIATGSGFPMFEPGIIITNCHVIEGGSSFEANTESGTYFKIDEIVAVDVDRDIAILHTSAKTGFEIFTPGDTSTLMKGEKVVAIGSPLGLINTVSDGMFSNLRSEEGNEYLQFTAPISHGSSGGALFNDKGEVIGITSASYVAGQNLNLAIPIEAVVDVWEHKDEYPVAVEPAIPQITVTEYYANPGKYDRNYIIEGYISTKYHEKPSPTASHLAKDSYDIFLVSDIEHIVGHDLLYQSTVTPTRPYTLWWDEVKTGRSGRYGTTIWLNVYDFNRIKPGDYIVVFVGYDENGKFKTEILEIIQD